MHDRVDEVLNKVRPALVNDGGNVELVGVDDDQALKMDVKTVKDIDFLVVERGGFNATPDNDEVKKTPKDWHCGYHIYVRQK